MIFDDSFFNELCNKARDNTRFRINFNLHESKEDKVQRLFNAMEPETIIPVQRHLNADETIILIRGRMKVCFYDERKNVIKSVTLDNSKGLYGAHIKAGVWHGVEVLDSNTVIFEVKEGPYAPLSENEILK